MTRGVNKVILIGNAGNDPETRFLPSGDPVANLSIATSEQWTDKQSGQKQEKTEWHKCVFFGRLAEIVGQYVRKGSKIYVEGSLQNRKWQAQDGTDRYSTEIKVRDMQLLDSRQDGQQGGRQQGGYQRQGGYQQQPQQNYQDAQAQYAQQQGQPRQQQQGQGNYGAPNPGGFDDFNDEIPF